jgi:Tfp pilus assembly protein PilO
MRYITAILLSSLATALVVFYAYPLYTTESEDPEAMGVVQLQAETARTAELVKSANTVSDTIRDLRQKRDALNTQSKEAVDQMVPRVIVLEELSNDIYNLGVNYGVSLANPSITKAAKDDKATHQKYTIAISFETNYDTALMLIRDIEYSLRLRDIQALSISPSDDGARAKVSVEFVTYALQ